MGGPTLWTPRKWNCKLRLFLYNLQHNEQMNCKIERKRAMAREFFLFTGYYSDYDFFYLWAPNHNLTIPNHNVFRTNQLFSVFNYIITIGTITKLRLLNKFDFQSDRATVLQHPTNMISSHALPINSHFLSQISSHTLIPKFCRIQSWSKFTIPLIQSSFTFKKNSAISFMAIQRFFRHEVVAATDTGNRFAHSVHTAQVENETAFVLVYSVAEMAD